MATQVQGLFGLNPEEIQAQQDALLQERAKQFSQMTPRQKASYGIFMGVNQLGSGIAQAMGYESPEMKAAKERQGLLSGMDITNPQALREAAQKAWNGGQHSIAQALLQQANQYETEQATVLKTRAEAAAKLLEKTTTEQKNAQAWADTIAERGSPEWAKAFNEKFKELTTKEGSRISYGADAEIVSRAMFGKNFNDLSPQEAAEVQKKLEISGITKAKAGATNVSTVVTNKAAEQFGSKFGQLTAEQAAQIEGKYSSIDYIQEAKELLKKGIYSGQFGPEELFATKATKGLYGDLGKAQNTEKFIAYLGNTIIPRLQEFGGNDSVEELNYLKNVQAGNIRLEEGSIKDILDSSERAIKRGIDRIKRSVTSVGGGTVASTDAGPDRAARKPTKRFNPSTGKLEEVK